MFSCVFWIIWSFINSEVQGERYWISLATNGEATPIWCVTVIKSCSHLMLRLDTRNHMQIYQREMFYLEHNDYGSYFARNAQ